MEKKVYYITNSAELNEALRGIKRIVPCFINREYIEMDLSEVEIIARTEDIPFIEKMLAPLVWQLNKNML